MKNHIKKCQVKNPTSVIQNLWVLLALLKKNQSTLENKVRTFSNLNFDTKHTAASHGVRLLETAVLETAQDGQSALETRDLPAVHESTGQLNALFSHGCNLTSRRLFFFFYEVTEFKNCLMSDYTGTLARLAGEVQGCSARMKTARVKVKHCRFFFFDQLWSFVFQFTQNSDY